MLEFREAIRRTELKLDLLEQGEKLESESKRLDADIHRLRIIAHNEQADVENIKTPGIKGLLLGITGRKQEVQEKEEAEEAAQSEAAVSEEDVEKAVVLGDE